MRFVDKPLWSQVGELWIDLDRVRHAPRSGEGLLYRLATPAWEHDYPAVQSTWEELTRPENLPELEQGAKLDMNPTARTATDAALRMAKSL